MCWVSPAGRTPWMGIVPSIRVRDPQGERPWTVVNGPAAFNYQDGAWTAVTDRELAPFVRWVLHGQTIQHRVPRPTFVAVPGVPLDSQIEMRISEPHRQRFLQTGILRGRIGSEDDPLRFELETVTRADLTDLDASSRHDVALILNRSATGTPLLSTIAEDMVDIHSPTGSGEVEHFASLLERPVSRPDGFTGYASPEYRDLLIRLAGRGHDLYRGLFGRSGVVPPEWDERLRTAARISILSARPGTVLPLELVYDRPVRIAHGSTGRLCAHPRPGPTSAAVSPIARTAPPTMWCARSGSGDPARSSNDMSTAPCPPGCRRNMRCRSGRTSTATR